MINDVTDATSIYTPIFDPCVTIAADLVHHQRKHPDVERSFTAGDVDFDYDLVIYG